MTTKSKKQLRTLLSKAGYQLRKGRGKTNADNLGGYMIIDANTNAVIAGSRFELTLEDVEIFIKEEQIN